MFTVTLSSGMIASGGLLRPMGIPLGSSVVPFWGLAYRILVMSHKIKRNYLGAYGYRNPIALNPYKGFLGPVIEPL